MSQKYLTLNIVRNDTFIHIDEQWKSLESLGFSNFQVSTCGRIINRKTMRFLDGYVKKKMDIGG